MKLARAHNRDTVPFRSIDSFQNGTCADHYQKTNNMDSGPLRYTIWHFAPHYKPDLNALLTLVVNSPLIWIFAILMKVNWQLSNESICWPSSPDCIAGSFFYLLKSSILLSSEAICHWKPNRYSAHFVAILQNSPIQDYVHPDDQTQPTFEMTPGFKPFTVLQNNLHIFCCPFYRIV